MFYCTDILRKNDGKFGAIWLAAVYGKTKTGIQKILTRRQITQVNISEACTDVLNPTVRFSLRLQSNLMIGILRVYKIQVFYFCDEIKLALRQLRMAFHVDQRLIDLHRPQLSKDTCTLPDPIDELVLGDFDDFPKDIFLRPPAELFPMDPNSQRRLHSGSESPGSSSSPHDSPRPPGGPPFRETPGPHQATKSDITRPESTLPDHVDTPIEVPGPDTLSPPLPDHEEETPMEPERSPPDDTEMPLIIDKETAKLRPASPDPQVSPSKQRAPSVDMVTPTVDRLEPALPSRPQKRKGQPVDPNPKLSDERIKRNIMDVRSTLKDQIIDVPILTVRELFNNPTRAGLQSAPFIGYWQQTAFTAPTPDDDDLSSTDDDEFDRSPELPRGPTLPMISDYERSGTDSWVKTPVSPSRTSSESHHPTPDLTPTHTRGSSILPGPEPSLNLSPIPEAPIDEVPLPEIPEIPDLQDSDVEDGYEERLQRHLVEVMGEREETRFSEVFPPHEAKKIVAAKGFFQLLGWHQQNVVVLSQPDAAFSEIFIERGRRF